MEIEGSELTVILDVYNPADYLTNRKIWQRKNW